MSIKYLILALCFVLGALTLPLDDYVNLPDSSYAWELSNTVTYPEYTLYILKLTSQTWTFVRTDKPVWQHWVRIIVPNQRSGSANAMVYANGGGNPLGGAPNDVTDYLVTVALNVGDIVVELNQIPNQPLVFEGEDFGRSEDSLLAKSWDMFIQSRDPMVIARLPMVKSVVKCMDATQEFVPTLPGVVPPKNFLIAGGSKRGWVTWLTGAVDLRVIGIAPLVIDVLDMQPNFNEIYQTYGRWPVALTPYTDENITRCLNCPVFQELAAIEDPLTYLDRFKERNIPIFAVNSCGDEFFIPTSWKWWFPQYSGEKYIRYMSNAEHSLATAINRVVSTMSAFVYTFDNNIPRPQFTWDVSPDGATITVQTQSRPSAVRIWEAYNSRSRKFIVNCYLTCLWTPFPLRDQGNGTFIASVEIPTEGYRAFFVELDFDIGYKDPLTAGTGVSIVPDQFDHELCPDSECALCDTC